jgi:hypothetical protein
MIKTFNFTVTITILILFVGCKGDTGPAGPSLSGNITGTVSLFNADGTNPNNKSGVTVTAQGTSFSTTTDSLGRWTLSGLSTGSYTVVETKPGYGMSEQQNLQLVSGTIVDGGTNPVMISDGPQPITLAQPPIFTTAIDSITSIPDSMITVWFTSSGQGDPAHSFSNLYLVVVGTDSTVNPAVPNSFHSDPLPVSEFEAGGFAPGQTAYIAVYPLGYGSLFSSYYDIATGRTAYTSVGPSSKVIKVTIP